MKLKILPVALMLLPFLSCSPKAYDSLTGDIEQNNKRIKVEITQPVLPVLALKDVNPVLKIRLIKNTEKEVDIKNLSFRLVGSENITDIKSVSLYHTTTKGNIDFKRKISEIPTSSKLNFKEGLILQKDTLDLWLTVAAKNEISLSNKFSIRMDKLEAKGYKTYINIKGEYKPIRTGVALRKRNDDGVNTSRIPGLATSKKGTLLAIYDARWDSSRDLQGDIDIALNRSFDKGKTWGKMQIVLDMKEYGQLPEKFNGVSDACILSDPNTGDIYVAGLWMYGIHDNKTGKWIEGLTEKSNNWIHQWSGKGSQPGLSPKETCQFLITKSTDDGATWSEPINITQATKRPEWWLYAPCPGNGIVLKDGTLVFPTQGRDNTGKSFSNITYSKDGGKTWKTSNPAYYGSTESAVVELPDGTIMLNSRFTANRGKVEGNGRKINITRDLGETWIEHHTSGKALIEPACMGSLHQHEFTRNGKRESILFFFNPDSYNKRDHLTLKVSMNNGESWNKNKFLFDEYSGAGYSCITSVDENTIGIFYEGSQANIVYQQIGLNEILNTCK